MGKELPFPFHPSGDVRNEAGCAERERKKKPTKNGKGSFGQTFISCLVLTNRAGGAAGTAAWRASCKINAYGDTSAKVHISILHVGLANMQNKRCAAQAAADQDVPRVPR